MRYEFVVGAATLAVVRGYYAWGKT